MMTGADKNPKKAFLSPETITCVEVAGFNLIKTINTTLELLSSK